MKNNSSFKNKLEESGHSFTSQRAEVYSILCENAPAHLTAEEIFIKLTQRHLKIGLSTVYRTLGIFTNIGITDKVDFDDGMSRYELVENFDGKNHRHHHLICLGCGRVEDALDDLMEDLENDVLEKFSFNIIDHSVKLYGYCAECSMKNKIETGSK